MDASTHTHSYKVLAWLAECVKGPKMNLSSKHKILCLQNVQWTVNVMQMIAENHFEAIKVLYPSRRHAHKYVGSDDDIH